MNKIKEVDKKDFENCYKIALVAMFDDEDDIHIALYSSLMNKGDDKFIFGEFVIGESKRYIHEKPKTGFLIMSVSREFWTGKMKFTHFATEGEDYVKLNEQPLFRFNTYMGVHKVHYADLIDISERTKLDMGGIVKNALKVLIRKSSIKGDVKKPALKPWAQKFLSKIDTLMFIGFEDEDGYPVLVPVIQAQAVSPSRIVLTRKPYADILKNLKDGQRVAIYGASLDMDAVLVKGTYHDYKKDLGYVDIDKVYNTVPPKHGRIF